jgi:cyclopropane fatty-acyl-phospholipid synthase-like methyltransferase
VKFELTDYRNLDDRFDLIVSVGMFEHVGAAHYDEFFAKCRELLKRDGVMLLHTIGKLGGVSKAPDPFTDKYIFPRLSSAVAEPDDGRQREAALDRQRRREFAAALSLHAARVAEARDCCERQD